MRIKKRGELTTRMARDTALGNSYAGTLANLVIISSITEISDAVGAR
jgi:predicted phage tail protein